MQCLRYYLEIGLLAAGLEIIVWSSKRSIYLVVLIILQCAYFANVVTNLGQAILDLCSGCRSQTVSSNMIFFNVYIDGIFYLPDKYYKLIALIIDVVLSYKNKMKWNDAHLKVLEHDQHRVCSAYFTISLLTSTS